MDVNNKLIVFGTTVNSITFCHILISSDGFNWKSINTGIISLANEL